MAHCFLLRGESIDHGPCLRSLLLFFTVRTLTTNTIDMTVTPRSYLTVHRTHQRLLHSPGFHRHSHRGMSHAGPPLLGTSTEPHSAPGHILRIHQQQAFDSHRPTTNGHVHQGPTAISAPTDQKTSHQHLDPPRTHQPRHLHRAHTQDRPLCDPPTNQPPFFHRSDLPDDLSTAARLPRRLAPSTTNRSPPNHYLYHNTPHTSPPTLLTLPPHTPTQRYDTITVHSASIHHQHLENPRQRLPPTTHAVRRPKLLTTTQDRRTSVT